MIDFEKHPDWSVIFDRNLDPERIVAELEIQLNAKINRGEDQHGDHVPKNFYEFLLATGSDKLSEIILKEPEKLPRSVHGSLLEQLRNYMYIGGMPECVKSWAQTKSMADVFDIQSDL